MAALQTVGIGSVLTLQKMVAFLKKVPTNIIPQDVAACGVSPDEYAKAFQKEDDKITADVKENIMAAHPDWPAVDTYLESLQGAQ